MSILQAEGFGKDAFLTSLRGGAGEASSGPEPTSMPRVRRLHTQLSTVVGSLTSKIDTLLKQ